MTGDADVRKVHGFTVRICTSDEHSYHEQNDPSQHGSDLVGGLFSQEYGHPWAIVIIVGRCIARPQQVDFQQVIQHVKGNPPAKAELDKTTPHQWTAHPPEGDTTNFGESGPAAEVLTFRAAFWGALPSVLGHQHMLFGSIRDSFFSWTRMTAKYWRTSNL
ncbi:hypothetical protein DOTSEDRAFT_39288 [Dothistroma septosporum NZE10]|uniref:Uncharacterized protein n=1 Tax=Dothistroma septosporum (strain NZE10 / CBS 128990) TaxID=675120 RepID=N1PBL3_DOTSN|nr:hypothetical protein DOTSEDRAFT_39288 [Dothistroma septosporum NZE10]